MVQSDVDTSEPEQHASTPVVPTQLQLLDEITRLSRIHIDLAACLERQTRLVAKLQDDLGVVARETTRNAETLFDRAVARIDSIEREYRAKSQLHADLTWYPTWSETAPLSGDLLISIVIPTRDRRELLERALNSLAQQSYANWEAVIVDDASTDDTADVVRSIAAGDSRIRLIQSDGSGSAAARQRALHEANGQVVTYLDDDNLMGHGWLRAIAEFFGRNSTVDVVYGAQLRLEDDSASSGSQPFVLFEPYDEIRLAESNFIDMGVIAHRAGLPVQHPAGVRGVDDWHFILDLVELGAPWPLPVVASIYLTSSSDRESQRADHHLSEESTRSRSAHRRLLDDRFADGALRSTRSAASYQVGSPVPTMTRLDGEILHFVLVALARRHQRPLRVVDWSSDDSATSIVQFLMNAGLETNWLSFRSGLGAGLSLKNIGRATKDAFVSNSLTTVTASCCVDAGVCELPDVAIEEPACVQSVRDLGVTFDALLIDSRVGCIATEVARSLVGTQGIVLVRSDSSTTLPDLRGYASSARIGHRLWIASPSETDFATIVPVRGLIEGSERTL